MLLEVIIILVRLHHILLLYEGILLLLLSKLQELLLLLLVALHWTKTLLLLICREQQVLAADCAKRPSCSMVQKWVHLIHHSKILLVHTFDRLLAASSTAHWEVDCLEGERA